MSLPYLLKSDGSDLLVSAQIERGDGGVSGSPLTLASEGAARHTRAVHQRSKPTYTITLDAAARAEWAAVVSAWIACRGGAGAVLWRSPDDPPITGADPQTGTRYRFASPGLSPQRSSGGALAKLVFSLEQV